MDAVMSLLTHLGLAWRTPEEKKETVRNLKSLAIAIFLIFGILRPFVAEPYKIPSGSMIPTLLVGDFIGVTKFSYGYSRYSLPFNVPLIPKMTFDTPKIGDVVVFKGVSTPDMIYIKRVVGLPGDKVQMKAGILYINEVPAPVEYVGPYSFVDERNGQTREAQKFVETLPGGVRHEIIKIYDFGHAHMDNTGVYVVPEGHYFMMGDNRDESGDSRYTLELGYIPQDHILGKAWAILFSTEASWWQVWKWHAMRFSRFFTNIYTLPQDTAEAVHA